MDDTLKAQIIHMINDTYLCELCYKYTGYLRVSMHDLINHLIDQYG
jgi:hypothetical protein